VSTVFGCWNAPRQGTALSADYRIATRHVSHVKGEGAVSFSALTKKQAHLVGFCLKAVERVWIALQGSCSHHGTFAKSARSSRLALGQAREAAIIFAFAGQTVDGTLAVCRSGGLDRDECARSENKGGNRSKARAREALPGHAPSAAEEKETL
jgi:hypothetical protein